MLNKIEKILCYTIYLMIAVSLCVHGTLFASGKIVAVCHYNNYPYEYINSSGKPSGFTVEIFKKVAESNGIGYELMILPPERVMDMIRKGEADIIIGGIKNAGYENYEFAGTAVNLLFTFFAEKNSSISDFDDLNGRRIAISGTGMISGYISDIIRDKYHANILIINDPASALLRLESGGCDAVFASDFRVRAISKALSENGVVEIPLNPGAFRYGYFIKKGRESFFKEFSSGLERLRAEEIYEKIYSQWFPDGYEESFFPQNPLLILTLFISAALFVIFFVLNNHILRRRINEKTDKLSSTIDELKKTETKLLRNEKRFRKIFDKSPIGILILDSSGRVLLFNESIKKIFGLTDPDEVYNLDVINSPNSTEWFKSRLKNFHGVSIEIKYDFEQIRQSGFYKTNREGEIIIDAVIFPFSIHGDSHGQGYICHFNDVTQNRLLLEYKQDTARRYEVIFDSVRDGLWEWRLDNDSLRVNRQYISLLGYRKDLFPVTFAAIKTMIHHDDRENVCHEIESRIKSGRSFTVEYRIRRSGGSWIWIRSRGEIAEWDSELSPTIVVVTHTDITELKEIESKYRWEYLSRDNDSRQGELFPSGDSMNGKKVLIVDDNCLITLYISEVLSRFGFLCIIAQNGIEAIDFIRQDNDLDIVLLDIEMPELDGITTMKLIKDINREIPVIANTGHSDQSSTDSLLCSGFDDVVLKPLQELVLLEKIRRLLPVSADK